jgi:hypothetical protein
VQLADPVFRRDSKASVLRAIDRLGVVPSDVAMEFYTRFIGPHWSESLGIELAEFVEEEPSVESLTQTAREVH